MASRKFIINLGELIVLYDDEQNSEDRISEEVINGVKAMFKHLEAVGARMNRPPESMIKTDADSDTSGVSPE